MSDIKQILKKYSVYVELVAYFLAFISVFLPFKKVEKKISNFNFYKRTDVIGLYREANTQKFDPVSEKASYIKFGSGVCVLIFTILSAAVVAFNTFARNVVENIKNKNKKNAKIIDIIIEVIPLGFTYISLLLTLISTGDGDLGKFANANGSSIKLAIGFVFLFLAIIIAIVIRTAYLIIVKEYIILINKPIDENKEINAKKTEQTTNEVIVPVN